MTRTMKLVIALGGLLFSANASAVVTLSTIDNGQYTDVGSHNPTNTNILTGDCCLITQFRSFFAFDTAGSGPATNISITFFGGNGFFSSPTGSETIGLYDYMGSIAALLGGSGGLAAFADLGSGNLLGQHTITAAGGTSMPEFTVVLSAAFVAQFNSAIGAADTRIAFGGSLMTIAPGNADSEAFWGQSTGAPAARLNITPVNAAVPEPSTWAMMLMGFGGIGFVLRRRKHSTHLTQMA